MILSKTRRQLMFPLACFFLPLLNSFASAQTLPDSVDFDLSIRGFGSLIATKTSDASIGWRVQNQPIDQARQYAGKWALNAESIVGVQIDANSEKDLSGSVQVVATNRSYGNIEPAFELAFLRYHFNPQWQTRIGRIWTPSFMNSETRNIGYSNTSLRNTNYTLYQITNLNGADLQYGTPVGSGNLNLAGYYGVNHYQLPNNAAGKDDYFNLPKIFGGFLSWENENLLLRSSFTRITLARAGAATASTLSVTVPALLAAATNGSCTICANEALKWERTRSGVQYDVFTLAAKYSWQNLTSSAEYIWRNTDSTFPKAAGFDVEVAANFGKWTPYLGFMSLVSLSNNQPVFSTNFPQFAGLNASYAAGKIDRKIITAGVKFDLVKNLSLRAELMQLRFESPTAGVGFAPTVTGSKGLPDKYRLASVSLDFLF